MLPIYAHSIDLLSELSEMEKNISNQSKWYGWIFRFLGIHNQRVIKITNAVCSKLDEMESLYVSFNNSAVKSCVSLKNLSEIHNKLSCYQNEKTNPEVNKLNYRIAALIYRLEGANGGESQSSNDEQRTFEEISSFAKTWKLEQDCIEEKELNIEEQKKINALSRYSQTADILRKDLHLRNQFFNWTIRDHHEVEPFVEFPAHVKKIQDCYLFSEYLGTYEAKGLHLSKRVIDGHLVKDLTLTCEGKLFSILNKRDKYTFQDGYQVSFEDMLAIFKEDEFKAGDLTIFEEGICHYNRAKWLAINPETKQYGPIDVSGPDWIRKLHKLKTLTQEEVEKRYKIEIKNPKNWVGAIRCTAKRLRLDIGDSHGYNEFAVSNSDGTFDLHSFGLYAASFPRTVVENLNVLARPVNSMIQSPDESFYRLGRRQGGLACEIPPERAQQKLDKIRDLHLHPENEPFQFLIKSCLKWSIKNFEDISGHKGIKMRFAIDFMELNPTEGVFAKIFNKIKRLPRAVSEVIITLILKIFGSNKEMSRRNKNGITKVVSVKYKPIWKKGYTLPHPAKLLIDQIDKKQSYSVEMIAEVS